VRMVWNDYVWLVGVQHENRDLTKENATLTGLDNQLTQLKKENQRFRKLLHYLGKRPDLKTVTARVIAKDISPYHRVLKVKIAAGNANQVESGMAVITPHGVVGHITRVVGDYAEVKTTVASGSVISVNVVDRDIKGKLVGSGDRNVYSLSFEGSDPNRQIRTGDILETNGQALRPGGKARFPKGLVVGYVTDSPPQHEEGGLRYVVRPSVPFGALEEVLVITSHDPTASGEGGANR
jgi:rod shape-determining protein MreC